ncbi:hypothetical protein [Mesorhizobium sp. INR15]|uniref:hypothetical protein n=1 Tax=Mesorhizobium sp. INR15 TaxID=2654248 RepID=UPI001AED3335|nr:hypothetical protein [Mesorhizobium sp. INR15]
MANLKEGVDQTIDALADVRRADGELPNGKVTYDCTEDCSGHKAGYDWAQQNGVSDTSDCSGNSQSFIEGCEAYVENPNRGSDEDDDGNEVDN